MLKKITYSVFLVLSVMFLILLFFKIEQCEEESYGWNVEMFIIEILENDGH
jgi:hypothetical protein